jgi:hypothetical protein
MRSGVNADGSSPAMRLDPFSLPLSFVASDAAADGQVRHVELFQKRVVVRRTVAGVRMALNMPLSAFAGICMRLLPAVDGGVPSVAVVLEHKDPGLSLSLFVATDGDDVIAEWHSWSQVLGLPQLIDDEQDGWRETSARLGGVRVARVRPRRRRHSMLKSRRPTMPLRRKSGGIAEATRVRDDGREMIAGD